MSIAIIFNGQGAHYQGMGQDFIAHYPVAKKVYQQAEELTGYPIRAMINNEIEKLEQTRYAQVAIVATSLAIYQSIAQKLPAIQLMAGLSLGEYTALLASESVSFEDGFKILKDRGQVMANHCQNLRASADLAMEVVLGMPLTEIKKTIAAVNQQKEELYLANLNSTQQVILAGTTDALVRFKAHAKEKGYRKMMPLKVEGPFHSPYMEAVCLPYEKILADITFSKGQTPVISNTTVEIHTVPLLKERLVRHLVEPVRWQETMQAMMDAGVDKIIQIGPGKTLANLLKREPNAPSVLVIDRVADVEKIEEFVGG